MFVGHDFAASQVAVGCPNFCDIQGVLQWCVFTQKSHYFSRKFPFPTHSFCQRSHVTQLFPGWTLSETNSSHLNICFSKKQSSYLPNHPSFQGLILLLNFQGWCKNPMVLMPGPGSIFELVATLGPFIQRHLRDLQPSAAARERGWWCFLLGSFLKKAALGNLCGAPKKIYVPQESKPFFCWNVFVRTIFERNLQQTRMNY